MKDNIKKIYKGFYNGFYKDFRVKSKKMYNKVLYLVHNSITQLYYSFLKPLVNGDVKSQLNSKWSVLDFETYKEVMVKLY